MKRRARRTQRIIAALAAALPACLLTAVPEEQLSGGRQLTDRDSVFDHPAHDGAIVDQGASADGAGDDAGAHAATDASVDRSPRDVDADPDVGDAAPTDAPAAEASADSGDDDVGATDATAADRGVPDGTPGDTPTADGARPGQPVSVVNGDFEANAVKTWFWNWNGAHGNGALVPGAIPGWSIDDDPGIGGNSGKGDSGVEPGGNPGMRLFLNSVDGEVYQTTAEVSQTGDAFRLGWDLLSTYAARPTASNVLSVRLFYLDGTRKVTIQTSTYTQQQNTVFLPYVFDVVSLPPAAVGKRIGLGFDNITDQIDVGAQTWVGIDNVTLTLFR